jgi:hypothetical protein
MLAVVDKERLFDKYYLDRHGTLPSRELRAQYRQTNAWLDYEIALTPDYYVYAIGHRLGAQLSDYLTELMNRGGDPDGFLQIFEDFDDVTQISLLIDPINNGGLGFKIECEDETEAVGVIRELLLTGIPENLTKNCIVIKQPNTRLSRSRTAM